MEKNDYESYSIERLMMEMDILLNESVDVYMQEYTAYNVFENEKIGRILDELLKHNNKDLKLFNGSHTLNRIIDKYQYWLNYVVANCRNNVNYKFPISKDNIDKMTRFLINYYDNRLVDFVYRFKLIDDEYIANIIFDKFNNGKSINIQLFGYLLNYLYQNGKLNGNMIDYAYDKLINNTTGNSYNSFFENISDDIARVFEQHTFDKKKINNDKVVEYSNEVFRQVMNYSLNFHVNKDIFCSSFNRMILPPVDEDKALEIVISEMHTLNKYDVDYMINYIKNNLHNIKDVKTKLSDLDIYDSHYNSILLLLLGHDDISNYDKIEILKVLCTDMKYANNIFNYNYINPSDFVDIIPKNNSNYLSKFMLFYSNKLSKEELVKLGKYVIASDNYRMIFNLCDRIDVISIDDFASEILEKSDNDIDSQMINWMIENNRDDELLDRVGSYEKLYAQICHKIVNEEKINDDIIKKIEDKCNPMFVIQMQFMVSELIEMQKKFDDMLNSERVRMKKENMHNKMMMVSRQNTTGRSKTRSLKPDMPKYKR